MRRRYVDFTTDRVVGRLLALDAAAQSEELPLFVRLIDDPNRESVTLDPQSLEYRQTHDLMHALDSLFTVETLNLVSPNLKALAFDETQARAFKHFVRNRVHLVFGGPGCGKSHYLALLIMRFLEARYHHVTTSVEDGFKVIVTGFTNTAVNKLMTKLATEIAPLWRMFRETLAYMEYFEKERTQLMGKVDGRRAAGGDGWNVPVEFMQILSSDNAEELFGRE
eukprot:CAMPEP_0119148626 /NCGR_PEP_ID=MMETSP1310-20130426/42131_1 /TAXON_ID=464262 /ORGANISM="Genus nov. species nov., Strain RCC2339" /LENGTH=222 /DNA_ID=CAMNT_0007140675 /DNA_START=18 /DNA_END=683 /DNA_ORIENTATION=-